MIAPPHKWRPSLVMVTAGMIAVVLIVAVAGFAIVRFNTRASPDVEVATALALALLAALAVGFVFVRAISRPLSELAERARRISAGDAAAIGPLAYHGTQELAALSESFMSMAQSLSARSAYLRTYSRHVSHELKTPLASLREGVGLLGDTLAGPLNPRQRSIVDIMNGSSRELQKRIEDLIRFGGLAADAAKPAHAPVALTPLLQGVAERQRLSLDTRGLAVEIGAPDVTLNLDAARLETALDNLLSNAIKFSPDGGRILIHAEMRDDQLTLDVCDAGGGIPQDERARVFEPFYQGSRQPAAAVKGSGLGLAIVRESMRGLGGDAMLAEREPWTTCFRLTCPCALTTH